MYVRDEYATEYSNVRNIENPRVPAPGFSLGLVVGMTISIYT